MSQTEKAAPVYTDYQIEILKFFQIICRQMAVMEEMGTEPTWENFSQTGGWLEIKKGLGELGQKNYEWTWGEAWKLRGQDPAGFKRVVAGELKVEQPK